MLTLSRYGSVIGYNVYWLVVILGFVLLRWKEKKGQLPFQKRQDLESSSALPRKESGSDEASSEGETLEKHIGCGKDTVVREASE